MSPQTIDSYRALDPDKLIRTTEKLVQRIGERFPDAGLYRVSQELLDTAHMVAAKSAALRRPIAWVRVVDGVIVGEYFADLFVEHVVLLELKAADAIDESHTAQLINYLKATKCEVGFVLNFGPEPKFERRYFSNHRKTLLTHTNPR